MVQPRLSIVIPVERDDVEIDVEVRGVFYPPSRGSFFEPPEPAGVEDLRAYRLDTGAEIELDDTERQFATDALLDSGDVGDTRDPDRAWDERGGW